MRYIKLPDDVSLIGSTVYIPPIYIGEDVGMTLKDIQRLEVQMYGEILTTRMPGNPVIGELKDIYTDPKGQRRVSVGTREGILHLLLRDIFMKVDDDNLFFD